MKTEYRIITNWTFIRDRYLQFKSTKKCLFGHKTVWRYIPEKNVSKVLGYYLKEFDCPSKLGLNSANSFLNCFDGQEDYELTNFPKKYPNIEKYFEYLREKRKSYLSYLKNRTEDGHVTLLT